MTNKQINRPIMVDHIARIEGKAGIKVQITDNLVKDVEVNVFEGPRFFEAITKNKPIDEAVAVFPRICSFCAAAHKITAIEAVENALNLEPTEQTKKLRELLYIGDFIESHTLHLFFLAMPDFYGYASAVDMAKDYKDIIKTAMQLKDLGARLQTLIGSRQIHQENALVGGFGKIPTKTQLSNLVDELRSARKIAELPTTLLTNFDNWPEVTRPRRHLALNGYNDNYTMLGESINSTDGSSFKSSEYQQKIVEKVVPHSFAKHGFYKGETFMTSALSRITLFGDRMNGPAREKSLIYKSHLDPNNPMSNNFAQAIEIMYFIDRAFTIVEELIGTIDTKEKPQEYKPVAGKGYSMTEAPRGLLAYNINIDNRGLIEAVDIITPTAMFLPILEEDIRQTAQRLLDNGLSDVDTLGKKLETIVRSYDPCISCSVHAIRVD